MNKHNSGYPLTGRELDDEEAVEDVCCPPRSVEWGHRDAKPGLSLNILLTSAFLSIVVFFVFLKGCF
jgi:hypothetical protein